MKADKWNLSISQHTHFLGGYLDAVGRALTSDTELVSVSARLIGSDSEAKSILEVSLGRPIAVDDWSKEFGSLVENMLRLDQRSSLGFYLTEYVCWFKEFLSYSRCTRFECLPRRASMLAQAVYILELGEKQRVLLVASRSTNATR